MTTREAWITVLFMVVVLLAMLFVAGMVSEWLVPTVRTEIGGGLESGTVKVGGVRWRIYSTIRTTPW